MERVEAAVLSRHKLEDRARRGERFYGFNEIIVQTD
jgi:hypothetical protein